MSAPRAYAFKPAAMRAPVSYELDAAQLSETDGWDLALTDVTAAAFATQVMKGTRFMRLDLWAGETRRSLSYSGAAAGWTADPDARAFLELARDTLDTLAGVRPDLDVTLGARGGPRLAMFAIGIAAILLGAGVFTGALASGVSADRLVAAAMPMGLLTLIGAFTALANSPWRKPPLGRPQAVARVIDGLIAKLAPAPSGD